MVTLAWNVAESSDEEPWERVGTSGYQSRQRVGPSGCVRVEQSGAGALPRPLAVLRAPRGVEGEGGGGATRTRPALRTTGLASGAPGRGGQQQLKAHHLQPS